ncbi:hypothetical protein LX32DRAFT_435209 [Colletotrichum zoysiae]|uniref:Uncharacterized protein n=1 Tax=Colletotrichum zoysiae TaxID=1216348 RepID=A0AAD9M065_9PEZI|nr:hypothetical protein LX32DRAFT_435209 [Colletotrichum zoysiae]
MPSCCRRHPPTPLLYPPLFRPYPGWASDFTPPRGCPGRSCGHWRMASLQLSVGGRTQTTWVMGRGGWQLLTNALQVWWRCLVPTVEAGEYSISRGKGITTEERTTRKRGREKTVGRLYSSVHADPSPARYARRILKRLAICIEIEPGVRPVGKLQGGRV